MLKNIDIIKNLIKSIMGYDIIYVKKQYSDIGVIKMFKFKRVVGLILIIVGLSLIGKTLYNKYETNKRQESLKAVLQEVINDDNPKEELTVEEINGYKPIAIIDIPSIKLSQGLVEGVEDNILQYYLGHFESSVMPGEKGNFSIAGHRVSDYSEAFINLVKTQIGDKVFVKYKGKEYIYEITESFVVDPDRVDVLDNTEEATITMVTCTVGAKQRLIVKGKLVETKDM